MRRNDDLENAPRKRRGEMFVHVPDRVPIIGGFEFAASGSTVILSIIAAGAFGLGFLHDSKTDEAHKEMVKAQLTGTCVLTLTPEERIEYRKYGSYCWDPEAPAPYFVGRQK